MWCAIFGFTAVYASTYYLSRRSLWTNITSIQTQHPIPWCCIGDFNTILGAQEHKGSTTPARTPMLDFQDWSDSNNLLHLPTQRAFYTWSNGRRGRHATLKRLDRAICNIDWINACSTVKVSTLTKLRSDHFPILLEFKNQDIHVASNFKFMKMWIADDMNFYGIFSIIISNKMTKTNPIRRKTYKSRKKHQDKVQDAKRQEKAKKVKKISIPSQHDGSHRATMGAACSPRKQKK
ncbi:hypothetical protein QL285_015193 [Trifolium repens]|nr:hypothetical protein QL285_015193 [Trifolium repens]